MDKAQSAAGEFGGGVEAIELDVADSGSIARGSSEVLRRFVGVDILVNNADIHCDSWERATNADWMVIREAFEINVFGAWRLAQLLAEPMRRQGWGRIVNVLVVFRATIAGTRSTLVAANQAEASWLAFESL